MRMKNKGIATIVIVIIIVIIIVIVAVPVVYFLTREPVASTAYTGTGVEVYSGTWSGSGYSGNWEFEVNWNAGAVNGWFTLDTEGPYDVSGTVSPGAIDVEGTAAFGQVSWSGTFSTDGSSVSGDWSFDVYSGTWSGTRST